jgi:hypothetical protein
MKFKFIDKKLNARKTITNAWIKLARGSPTLLNTILIQ